MNLSFNLVEQPWIPCITSEGQIIELNLREVLARAHEMKGVRAESPPCTAAVYRLILAVLQSALRGPENSRAWKELWLNGAWDMNIFTPYLEKWKDRFDLFHPEWPFYQTKDNRVAPKSVLNLVLDMASGDNATLFDHHTEDEGAALSPAQATRALLAAQAFGLAGLCHPQLKLVYTDAPWSCGIVLLIEGNNLFQTLALNLLPYNEDWPFRNTPADKPAWEMDQPLLPQRETPLGYLDYLTWHNRSIFLVPDDKGTSLRVKMATILPGLRLSADLPDLFKQYRMDEKFGMLVWRFSEDRILWRDSSALFQMNAPSVTHPPANFRWVAELVRKFDLDSNLHFRYMALGMGTPPGKAKVDFFREEHMPLPLIYLKRIKGTWSAH